MAGHDDNEGSRRGSLIALGVVVALFFLGWVLAHELYRNARLEDCVLAGRTNCAPIETPGR